MRSPLFLSVLSLAVMACATPLRPPPRSGWAQAGPPPQLVAEDARGWVLVHYPAGACATGWLDVETFERQADGWAPHAGGSRVRTGSCRFEPPDRLLNETRVRCVDPSGQRAPSAWVIGVAVDHPSELADCAVGP